jgi:Family of unknown function (DUF6353)
MIQVAKYIPNAVTTKVARTILQGSKHSPTILFAGGIIGVVATTVLASRATLKLDSVLSATKENLHSAKTLRDADRADYSEEDYKKDVTYIYAAATVDIVKLYTPAVLVGVASIAMLTKSHTILNKRNASLTAAYAALDKAFTEYRGRVIKELGPDKDREFRYDSEERTAIRASDGKEVKVVRVGPKRPSGYARMFDPMCPDWNPNWEYNQMFLKAKQNYANDMLQSRGHLFLNEVYDMLGLEHSTAGAVVGWVISKNGDNFVDFGLFDTMNPMAIDFVNGREGSVLLDFNVDGVIYDLI